MSMIRGLLLWFYRLSYFEVILLVTLASLCFVRLRMRWRTYRFWKMTVWACCVVWICVVVGVTLGGRSADAVCQTAMLRPFHSYVAVWRGETSEILRSNFMNVVLFYPLGLLLDAGLPERWVFGLRLLLIGLLGMVVSAGIEYCQYFFCLGAAEIDDVIHNSLGAVLGILPGCLYDYCEKHQ